VERGGVPDSSLEIHDATWSPTVSDVSSTQMSGRRKAPWRQLLANAIRAPGPPLQ
jgi:glucose-6-phosphate dehydrogenase assembly protein OpcA